MKAIHYATGISLLVFFISMIYIKDAEACNGGTCTKPDISGGSSTNTNANQNTGNNSFINQSGSNTMYSNVQGQQQSIIDGTSCADMSLFAAGGVSQNSFGNSNSTSVGQQVQVGIVMPIGNSTETCQRNLAAKSRLTEIDIATKTAQFCGTLYSDAGVREDYIIGMIRGGDSQILEMLGKCGINETVINELITKQTKQRQSNIDAVKPFKK